MIVIRQLFCGSRWKKRAACFVGTSVQKPKSDPTMQPAESCINFWSVRNEQDRGRF